MWHHPMVERIKQTMQFNNSICFWKSNWSKDVKGKKETAEKNIGFPGCHTAKTSIRNDSHCTGVPLMLPHLVIYFTHVARHHKPLPCTRTTTCIWHVWSSLYFQKKKLRFYRADEIQQRRRGAGRETEGYTPPNSESHQSWLCLINISAN